MNFLEHIQQIDKRVEERKEKELQKTLFGLEGDLDVEGALAMSTTYSSSYKVGGQSYRTTINSNTGKISTSTGYTIPGTGQRVTHRW